MNIKVLVRKHCITAFTTLLTVCSCAASTIAIGYFDDDQSVLVNGGSAPLFGNPKNATNSTANNAPADIGGQREFIVRRTTGGGSFTLDANITNGGTLNFQLPNLNAGRALITWDGSDTTTSTFTPGSGTAQAQRGEPNAFALGDKDLTDGGTNSYIGLLAAADNSGAPITFYFYRAAGVYATYTLNVASSQTLLGYYIPFTSFTAVGDTIQNIFTHVNAITMEINGPLATDVTVDNLAAVSSVPEPGTLVLFSGALAGLAVWSRRRRKS